MQRHERRDRQNAHDGQMKDRVGRGQQHENQAQGQVAVVARAQQQPNQHQRHHGQQCQVQRRIHRIRPHHRGHTRRQPEQSQRRQRRTTRRGQPGPGFAGRHQKANDDGHGKAKQHLMGMPQQGRHRGCHHRGQGCPTQKQGHPHRHDQRRQQSAAQVKRPKPQTQQWPTLRFLRSGFNVLKNRKRFRFHGGAAA